MSDWLWYSPGDAGTRVVEFDADYVDPESRKGLSELVEVSLSGFPVDDAGLPADSVVDSIFKLEESLRAVAGEAGGAYVADVAEKSTYRMLVYSGTGDLAGRIRSAIGTAFAANVASRSDAAWSSYDELALKGEELESLRDQQQLDEIDESGIDTSEGLEITFDFAFDDDEATTKAADAMRAAGYELLAGVEADSETNEPSVLEVTATCSADADAIGELRRKLTSIAAASGGTFAGWGYDPDFGDDEE